MDPSEKCFEKFIRHPEFWNHHNQDLGSDWILKSFLDHLCVIVKEFMNSSELFVNSISEAVWEGLKTIVF